MLPSLAGRCLRVPSRPSHIVKLPRPCGVVCFVNNGVNDNPTVRVKFCLPKKVAFGQQIELLGSKAELGGWDPTRSVSLEWHEGHEWTAECELPLGDYEYKYVIRGKGFLEWQPGRNIVLSLAGPASATVQVVDDWQNQHREIQVDSSGSEFEDVLLEEEVPAPPFSTVDPAAAEEAAAPLSAASANGMPTTAAAADPVARMAQEEHTGSRADQGSPLVGGLPVGKPLEQMTVKQLKELAKEFGLPVTGRKMDLVDRIAEAMMGD